LQAVLLQDWPTGLGNTTPFCAGVLAEEVALLGLKSGFVSFFFPENNNFILTLHVVLF
jgi:hypothetical protein